LLSRFFAGRLQRGIDRGMDENFGQQEVSEGVVVAETPAAAAVLSGDELRRVVEAAVGVRKEEAEARGELERQLAEVRAQLEGYRAKAEAAERGALVRDELRRLGVTNVELGYRAVRDEVVRREDGSLVAKTGSGEVALREFLARFVEANPELLPARGLGGSGSMAGTRDDGGGLDMDSIRPGMDPAEMERARREVARVISRSLQSR
jgi:hypothetical protein